MAGMSLEELKRQNAQTDEAKLEDSPEAQEEAEQESEQEQEALEQPEDESELSDDNEEESQVESWMQADDSEDEESEKAIPLTVHIDIRQKLKSKSREKDAEIEALRKEIEQLKTGSQQKQEVAQVAAPDIESFKNDYDEIDWAKYNQANAEYQQKLIEQQFQNQSKTLEQQKQEQLLAEQQQKIVDKISQQANDLVNKKQITADAFNNAFGNLQGSIENLVPGHGESVTNGLMAQIHEVTEGTDKAAKMVYKLGVDASARQKVIDAFMSDPTGVKGVIALSKLSQKFDSPVAKRSQAPKPAPQVQGEAKKGQAAEAAKMQKKYNDLHRKGKLGDAFKAKRKAKALGIDTKNW